MPLTKKQFSQSMQQAVYKAFAEAYSRDIGKFRLLDQGPVDDEPWYTIEIFDKDVWFWLTQQQGSWHHYRDDATGHTHVDMDEATYLALVMRWS